MDSCGAGLGAMGFWLFIAAAVLGGIWDGIKKRETQHETLRRMLASDQPIDEEMVDKNVDGVAPVIEDVIEDRHAELMAEFNEPLLVCKKHAILILDDVPAWVGHPRAAQLGPIRSTIKVHDVRIVIHV